MTDDDDTAGKPARVPAVTTLRAERERAIERLSDHYARDLLDVEEFERRLTLVHNAQAPEQLAPLTADLEPAPPARVPAPLRAPAGLAPDARVPASQAAVAIMGGTRRGGRWVVPRQLNAVAVMGGVELDFREAALGPGISEVRVVGIMGGVNLVVPPWLPVEMNGVAIMGGFEHWDRAPVQLDPDAPLLRITGVAIMGGVHIETRLPGEKRRAARARVRAEQLQARAQRALPGHDDNER